MAQTLSGSEKHPNLFKPSQLGKFPAPNSVNYAARSVSNSVYGARL